MLEVPVYKGILLSGATAGGRCFGPGSEVSRWSSREEPLRSREILRITFVMSDRVVGADPFLPLHHQASVGDKGSQRRFELQSLETGPATPNFEAPSNHNRDGRDKPGHDPGVQAPLSSWFRLYFPSEIRMVRLG